MRIRRLIPALAVAAVAAAPAAAAAKPDLEVRAVADPVPTGQAGSYGLRLKATVVNDGGAPARSSQLRFALSRDRRPDPDDTRLPLVAVDALDAGERDVVEQEWRIPSSVEAGIYHVVACVDSDCRVAEETVAVPERGGETTAQSGAPLPQAAAPGQSPLTEWFPEAHRSTPDTPNGMRVGDPFGCPASAHGQGDGRCVWVLTQYGLVGDTESGRVRTDFWYCPSDHPYPFEVALGFDPMWRDYGKNSDTIVETVAAKRWTPYQNIFGRQYYPSYGGTREQRGYVSITFLGVAFHRWVHMAEYLCSSQRATSMLG